MDEVRASVARALGQPGCRARVLVGTSGEISGPAPFRDAPETRAAGADAALTVVGYARVKKKDTRWVPSVPRASSAADAGDVRGAAIRAAFLSDGDEASASTRARDPRASPGRRLRTYITLRETEDEEDGVLQNAREPLADPLAAPVGGHARHRATSHRADPSAKSPERIEAPGGKNQARLDEENPFVGARGAETAAARENENGTRRVARRSGDENRGPPSAPSVALRAGDAMWAVLRDEAAAATADASAARLTREPVEATAEALSDPGDGDPKAKQPDPKPDPNPNQNPNPKKNRAKRRPERATRGPKEAPKKKAARRDAVRDRADRETVPVETRADESLAEPHGLPPCLERLARAYDATAAIAAFLRAQRVRSTWGQIEPAVRGAATLEDLRAAARLCPRALRLARRAVDPSAEAAEAAEAQRADQGAFAGDRPGDPPADRKKDTLVEVFDAGARARGDAEDAPFGGALDEGRVGEGLVTRSPARRVVVHGSRTSRATYAVGDAEPNENSRETRRADETAARRNRNRRGSLPGPEGFSLKKVSGEAFAARASAAFRAALGRLVLARVDAWIDLEGLDSCAAWERAANAGLETFEETAATTRTVDPAETAETAETAEEAEAAEAAERGDGAEPERRAAAAPPFSVPKTEKRRRGGSGGSGRRVCERCDALDVEAFIEHLTTGPDALGARGANFAEGEDGARATSGGCVEHRRDEPARAARFGASLSGVLSPATTRALAATGVRADALFSHQSAAVAASLRGENVVVATGTASGKSVCYNAPAFEALFKNPDATALYLFPTKALARDQVGKIRTMLAGAASNASTNVSGDETYHPFEVGAYDGDTPEDERARIFTKCRLLVTNPDTLHVSLLPRHTAWRAFFAGLAVVVLDEAHVYRGVFGSHVALVMRRLRRVCREVHGVDPAFVVTSATIGEPLKHAADLTGGFPRLSIAETTNDADVDDRRLLSGWTEVTEDGSPRGAKTFLMWNPPRKEALATRRKKKSAPSDENAPRGKKAAAEKTRAAARRNAAATRANEPKREPEPTRVGQPVVGSEALVGSDARLRVSGSRDVDAKAFADDATRRVSPIVEMAHLLVECARHDLRVIAFCKTKKLCELVLRYARELLLNSNGSQFLPTLRAYRGGYTAGDRRATESALFDGALRAVAATNALELGVDVGVLDATLHLGFPGSCSSLTQQAGRAGRRGKRALGIFVAFDGPLDQYFMRRPAKLFDAAEAERAAIDCANPAILAAHVACAAHELPLDPRPEGVDARTYFFTNETDEDASARDEKEPSAFRAAADALVRDARLARDPRVAARGAGDLRLRWVGDPQRLGGPARGVSVRTIESERYRVVDVDTGKTVEEIEASKAFWSVHPGAVYLNQARTFLVTSLDVATRVARVRRADVKYFTQSLDTTRLTLVDHSGSRAAYPDRPRSMRGVSGSSVPASSAQTARCEVTIQFTGFRKVHQGTGAFFDEVSFARDLHVSLPPVAFRTVASWVRIPESARAMAKALGIDFDEAAHAASHALVNALPLKLLASHADVAAECFAAGPGTYAPRRLLLYDRHPGGVGIARRAAPMFLELMKLALERVEACDCGAAEAAREGNAARELFPVCLPVAATRGCPGCVHYASCDHYNDGLDKRGAVVVLRETIRVEEQRLRGVEGREGEDASRGEGVADVSSE